MRLGNRHFYKNHVPKPFKYLPGANKIMQDIKNWGRRHGRSPLNKTPALLLWAALLSGSFQWWHFFYLIPMAHLAMAIPLNPPGAIGTAEAIYAYLLVQIGIEEGAVLCILQRLTYYSWSMVGAGFYITRKGKSSNGKARGGKSDEDSEDGLEHRL